VLPFPVLGEPTNGCHQQQRRNNNLFHTKVHINNTLTKKVGQRYK
jgi:hypothetical protein